MSAIKTPLTHNDAMEMAAAAVRNAGCPCEVCRDFRNDIAKALMAVDVASREQSGAKDLLDLLKSAAEDVCSNSCPSTWKTGEPERAGVVGADGMPHSPKCYAISAAIAKAEGR